MMPPPEPAPRHFPLLCRQTHSLTLRLTLLFASASTAVLLLLGWLVGNAVEQHFLDMDSTLLADQIAEAEHQRQHGLPPQQLGPTLAHHSGLQIELRQPDGRILYQSPQASFPPTLPTLSTTSRHNQSTPAAEHPHYHATTPLTPQDWQDTQGQPWRGLRVQLTAQDAPALQLAVATNISHHQHFMQAFRQTLWSVVIAAALLTGLLGWAAARRGLAPLQAIRREAENITAHRLGARLPTAQVPAELAALVETLNAMLARLESAFQRLSDFSSDLAHELRTPVSNLLTQTQVILAQPRSADDYRDILASNAEEFERLSRMIADMLFLAKADNQLLIPQQESVDLYAELRSLLDYYGILAEEKQITLTLPEPAAPDTTTGQVSGDRLMLRRALSNLLSNALNHTPAGGQIRLTLTRQGKQLAMAVQNTGNTIAPEHLPRLFDRFYRADAARQHGSQDGTGLGLSITRAILHAHGGEITVNSHAGLNTFTLHLPAASPPPP